MSRPAAIRFAVRRLLRSKVQTSGVLVTLALGLAAVYATLQMAHALHFRALPFRDPERLVRVYLQAWQGGPLLSLRAESFTALAARSEDVFEGFVGQRLTGRTLRTPEGAQGVDTLGVTAGWAEVLGLAPRLGRLFSAAEMEAGEEAGVVLLADSAWRAHFGADPSILGRTVVLDGVPVEVIGVLPAGYSFPYSADFWHPTRADRPSASNWAFFAPARLRPGITVDQANAALAALAPEFERLLPASQGGLRPVVVPLRDVLLDGQEWVVPATSATAALLLALIATNLAALFRTRWLGARRELAIRVALGASDGRVVAELLVEVLLLVGAGTGAAVVLTRLASPLLARQLPARLAELGARVEWSPPVAALTAVAAVLACGLIAAPGALGLRRGRLVDRLRADGGAGVHRSAHRATRLLVGLQFAAGLALVSGTLLLLLDLRQRARLDLGYEARRLVVFETPLTAARYASAAARERFTASALERLRNLPGVEESAAVNLFPSATSAVFAQVQDPARPAAGEPGTRLLVHNRLVTPGFARALGLRLIEGRWIAPQDDGRARRVAVVSRALARRLRPDGGSPLGLELRNLRRDDAPFEVVGVVEDLHDFHDAAGAWYLPLAQHGEDPSSRSLEFALRLLPGHSGVALREARRALDAIDADVAIQDFGDAESRYAENLTARRDAASATSFLAACGVVVAALGLFALVAESVLRRRREFALRMALGATPGGLMRDLVGDGLRLAAAGLVPGSIGALLLARRLAEALQSPGLATNPWPLGAGLGIVLAAVLAATLAAAGRVLAIEPATSLGDR